jgi:hypothetical protein
VVGCRRLLACSPREERTVVATATRHALALRNWAAAAVAVMLLPQQRELALDTLRGGFHSSLEDWIPGTQQSKALG